MNTEEILKPRFKVIADYPGSIYKMLEVFIEDGNKLLYKGVNHAHLLSRINDYPHLFKKLEWWEERKEIGYVCFNSEWHYIKGKVVRVIGNEYFRLHNAKFDVDIRYCTPISETEYQEYENQTKKQIL